MPPRRRVPAARGPLVLPVLPRTALSPVLVPRNPPCPTPTVRCPYDIAALAPRADFWSVRYVEESSETLTVRNDVALPPSFVADRGVMATVLADGGYGYAATSDLSPAGVRAALERAAAWARATARHAVADTRAFPRPAPRGDYASASPAAPGRSRREWLDLLRARSGGGGDRRPHRRSRGEHGNPLGHAPVRHQHRRRRDPALPLPAARTRGHRARGRRHADAHAARPPRDLPAGRRRNPAALRLRRTADGGSPTRRSSSCSRPTVPPAGWTCCSCPTR